MSFGIYIVGYIILIIGLAIGAYLLHVPQKWIGVGVLCLVGIAIIHGVKATRQKDPPSS
jgi:ABC-type multidrug transport system permease subunit